uniref:Uncharacterized protein n=1 Tax=Candidozyma auris TaxID=498019 RepID=A0A0L0P8N1_CANAR
MQIYAGGKRWVGIVTRSAGAPVFAWPSAWKETDCLEKHVQSTAHTQTCQTGHQAALVTARLLLLNIVLLLWLLLVVSSLRVPIATLRRRTTVALLRVAAVALLMVATT